MKTVKKIMLPLVVGLAVAACNTGKEIQVNMVSAELIKVDTVYRHPRQEILLTFRCQNKLELVSFAPMYRHYQVGTRYQVLLTK
jgi:hypothetical protein